VTLAEEGAAGHAGGGTAEPAAETAWRSASPAETRALARELGRAARPGDAVLLVGPLGAGKTCFVQGLALGLGVTSPVKSPTFVLLVEHSGRVPLAHLDLYRVEGARPLDELGIEEQIESHVLAVEWGEKLLGRLEDGLVVELEEAGPQARAVVARALGARGREWLAAWRAAVPAAGERA
jgi:tRNA threonylcarbamoyladenosine biosynthesis protein TsaE